MLIVAIALDQPRPDITRNKGVRPELIGAMVKLLLSGLLSRGIFEKGSWGVVIIQPLLCVTTLFSPDAARTAPRWIASRC